MLTGLVVWGGGAPPDIWLLAVLALGAGLARSCPRFTRFFLSTFSEPWRGCLARTRCASAPAAAAVTGRSEVRARGWSGWCSWRAAGSSRRRPRRCSSPLLAALVARPRFTAVGRRRWRASRRAGTALRAGGARLSRGGGGRALAAAPVRRGCQRAQPRLHDPRPPTSAPAATPVRSGLPPAALTAAGRPHSPRRRPAGRRGPRWSRPAPAGAPARGPYQVLLAHPAAAGSGRDRGAGLPPRPSARTSSHLLSAPVTAAVVCAPPVLGHRRVGPQGDAQTRWPGWTGSPPAPGCPVPWSWRPGLLARGCHRRGRSDRSAPPGSCGRVPPPRPPSWCWGGSRLSRCVSGRAVAAAVLGDGLLREIAKHTWLAAYFVEVTATSVLLGLAVVAARRTFAVIEARKRQARAA